MSAEVRPLRVFCSYAHEDEALRDKLEAHLAALKRSGAIEVWHDRKIVAGTDWRAAIKGELDEADLVLILMSAAFLHSDFCYSEELSRALERYQKRQAMVIPIVLRPVDWTGTPLEGVQALPANGRAITTWSNRDRGFLDAAQGVRKAVETFNTWRVAPPPAKRSRGAKARAASTTPVAETAPPDFSAAPGRIFNDIVAHPIAWLDAALHTARAIARIDIELNDQKFTGAATGFLVDAGEFGLGAAGESLLLTCWHLVHGTKNVTATFERLGTQRTITETVWSSPVGALNVVFLRLNEPVDTAPCPISLIRPEEMDEATPIYLAGYGVGERLRYSLSKNVWLDYKKPVLHYRAATQPGSGGSPVFDDRWRVIGLHYASGVHMPRLKGKGTYAACAGSSIHDVREATRKRAEAAKRRRRRTAE